MINNNQSISVDTSYGSLNCQRVESTSMQRNEFKQEYKISFYKDHGADFEVQKREGEIEDQDIADGDISKIYLEYQHEYSYQRQKFKQEALSIHQTCHCKIILFFDQQTLLRNLYMVKQQKEPVYFALEKGGIKDEEKLFRSKIFKLKTFDQVILFFKENQNGYSLVPFKTEEKEVTKVNVQFVMELFKKKYFRSNNSIIWRMEDTMQVELLKQDFLRVGVVVEQLNANQYILVNKGSLKSSGSLIDNWNKENVYIYQDKIVSHENDRITPINAIRLQIYNISKQQYRRRVEQQNLLEQIINKIFIDQVKLDCIQQLREDKLVKMIQFKGLSDESLVDFIKSIYSHSLEHLLSYHQIKERDMVQIDQWKRNQSNIYFHCLDQERKKIELKLKKSSYKETIEEANKLLRKNNQICELISLWKAELCTLMDQIIRNWQIHKFEVEKQTVQFTRLIEFRMEMFNIEEFSLFEFMLKGIDQLARRLLSILKLPRLSFLPLCSNKSNNNDKTNENNQGMKRNYLDRLKGELQIEGDDTIEIILKHYINHKKRENENQPKKILAFKHEGKKSDLNQFISERMGYEKSFSKLREVFNFINLEFQKKTKERQLNLTLERRNQYFHNIECERVMENRCLGCSPFFIYGMNIQDDEVVPYPVRAFSSVSEMKNFESEIKDEICAMLNSFGGIILLGCNNVYGRVNIRGTKLSQKDKEQFEQRLMSYIDVFEPKIEAKKSIKISFVPVLADPYQGEELKYENNQPYAGDQAIYKKDEGYRRRPFLQNAYVMRVRVCPSDGITAFYWNQNSDKQQKYQNKNYVCTAYKQGDKVPFKLSKINHLIKKKMKNHYLPEHLKQHEKIFLMKPFNCFNHECKDPEAGVGMQVVEPNTEMSVETITSEIRQNSYEYTSLLIIRKQHIGYIKKVFQSQGIDCQIECKFEEYKFTSAKNTAVMYHNKKFDDVLYRISRNPKFTIGDKMLLIISVTSFVKLRMRNENMPFPIEQLHYVREWVHAKFEHEQVKLFEFVTKEGAKEYYLQTESYDSTLYVYYLLNNYNEKSVFKNPLHLDKMSEEEKEKRWRQLFPERMIDQMSEGQFNCQSGQCKPNQTVSNEYNNQNYVEKLQNLDETSDRREVDP